MPLIGVLLLATAASAAAQARGPAAVHPAARHDRPITAAAERIASRIVLAPPVRRGKDTVLNGILVGAGFGAVAGLVFTPPAFCSKNDETCERSIRLTIGLPILAAGALIGWLVDFST